MDGLYDSDIIVILLLLNVHVLYFVYFRIYFNFLLSIAR